MNEESQNDSSENQSVQIGNIPDPQPKKPLPAKKLSTQKQFETLRSIAVASTEERNPVTIHKVADILDIHSNTVSICNPFFDDIGLIEKQGHKFIPSQLVIEFNKKHQWDPEKAGHKLASLIKDTWFARPVMQRLALRTMSKDEVISVFAEEASASPKYKSQLVMLLDYMIFAGLVKEENGTISLSNPEQSDSQQKPPDQNPGVDGMQDKTPKFDPDIFESFEIPIPGNKSAIIRIPKGLQDEDWEMLKTMLDAYISRLKKKNMGDLI